MKRETAKRLLDARNACLEIQHFAAGRSQAAIMTDRGVQLILQTLLVTIGEALNQVRQADPETANLIPDIHRAIGMRPQIMHGYDSIDYPIVWKVSTTDVPKLAIVLEGLMETAPTPEDDADTA